MRPEYKPTVEALLKLLRGFSIRETETILIITQTIIKRNNISTIEKIPDNFIL